MKNYEEERHQNEYLRKQLGQCMRAQRKKLDGTLSSIPSESNQEKEEEDTNYFASSSEEECARLRSSRRVPTFPSF